MAKDAEPLAKLTPGSPMADHAESVHISVEPIENGYLMRKSCSSADGYHCETTFHKEKPDVEMLTRPPTGRKATGALRGAVRYLNQK